MLYSLASKGTTWNPIWPQQITRIMYNIQADSILGTIQHLYLSKIHIIKHTIELLRSKITCIIH